MKKVNEINKYVIYSIGHGNRKIESFIFLLLDNQIDTLIDVRSYPYSRFHPQYRQVNLRTDLLKAGIGYQFLGKELGGRPQDAALYDNGCLSYDVVKETDLFKSGLSQVIALAQQNIKVTLMCSESDENQCHRKHLISEELVKLGLNVIHIDKSGKLIRHTINESLFS